MSRLRNSIIAILIFTGLALNIERLDFGSQNDVINIDSFVYPLLGVAVLSTLGIATFKRISVSVQLIGWAGVYLISKLLIFQDRPFVGGAYTYISVTEITLLLIGVLLANRITAELDNLETVLSNISLTDVSSRVMEFDEADDEIAREFVRSRRHKIPLSVLLIKLDPESIRSLENNSMDEIILSLMARYTANSLVRVLDRVLRRTDLIIEQPRSKRVILLLPETDADGTKIMASRIGQLSQDHLGIPISCGFATFPDEAITFEDLVQRAEDHYSAQSTHLADIVANEVENTSKQSVSLDN